MKGHANPGPQRSPSSVAKIQAEIRLARELVGMVQPTPDPQMVKQSRADYRRGEYMTTAELLEDIRPRADDGKQEGGDRLRLATLPEGWRWF